jgi:hypothetical protein
MGIGDLQTTEPRKRMVLIDVIAICFFIISAAISVNILLALISGKFPDEKWNFQGIIVCIVLFSLMTFLPALWGFGFLKRRAWVKDVLLIPLGILIFCTFTAWLIFLILFLFFLIFFYTSAVKKEFNLE